MPRSPSKKEQSGNVNFVLEVEKYPCLYNYTLDEYSKRDAVDAAWEKVAKALGEAVENCKDKWKNLRTVFVRKRKLPPSGSGRKIPYYLNEVMQFIVPYIKVQNYDEAPSNLPSPGGKDNEEDEDDPDEVDDDDEEKEGGATEEDGLQSKHGAEKTMKNNSRKAELDRSRPTKKLESGGSEKEKKDSSNSNSGGSKSKGDKGKRKLTSDVDAFVEYFQEKKKKLDEPDSSRKNFLLSLVPDVQAMNDCQFRFFRRNILDAIDNALGYNSRSVTPSSISSSSNEDMPNYNRVLSYGPANSGNTLMNSNPEYSNYQEFP